MCGHNIVVCHDGEDRCEGTLRACARVRTRASKLIMKYRPAIGMDHHCSRARVCHVRDLPGHPVVPACGGNSDTHTRIGRTPLPPPKQQQARICEGEDRRRNTDDEISMRVQVRARSPVHDSPGY